MADETGGKSINIPIKTIVVESMRKNGANYSEAFIMYLRRFFIASLNFGWIQINAKENDFKELEDCVNRFTSKIRSIEYFALPVTKKEKGYSIHTNHNSARICFYRQERSTENIDLESLSAFRSIFEVVCELSSWKDDAFKLAFIELSAFKLYWMDTKGDRIIMPKETVYAIGNKQITLRAGYREAFNLEISLLKQLFIVCRVNENELARKLMKQDEELNTVLENELFQKADIIPQVIELLDVIYSLDKMEKSSDLVDKEIRLIEDYQRILHKIMTDKSGYEYLAFCALVTSDALREELRNNN